MEQHSKALKILVYKLEDFTEAERFCELHSKVKPDPFDARFHDFTLIWGREAGSHIEFGNSLKRLGFFIFFNVDVTRLSKHGK